MATKNKYLNTTFVWLGQAALGLRGKPAPPQPAGTMTPSCLQHWSGQDWPRKRTNPVMSTRIPTSQPLGRTLTDPERRSEGDQERKRLSRAFSPHESVGGPARMPSPPLNPWPVGAPPRHQTPAPWPWPGPGQTPHTAGGPGAGLAGPSNWEKARPERRKSPPCRQTSAVFQP